MFQEGTILYINDYIFEDETVANKFFVILKNVDNSYLLTALPTHTHRIDTWKLPPNGCVLIPNNQYHCFLFAANQIITKCNKSFKENTHLYTRNIEEEQIVDFFNKYPLENINYTIWGEMKDSLFEELIECFRACS